MPSAKTIDSPALAKWKAKNPLRLWLDAQPTVAAGMAKLMRAIGVSKQNIYVWMTGFNAPDLHRFGPLTALTKISADDWVAWMAAAPPDARMCRRVSPSRRRSAQKT